ncbi:MAG: LLM class F420-dependent oxidoreductase [Myxococcota bacterium]
MRFSVHLPTDRVSLGDDFVSGEGVATVARNAEDAGFDACYVTDHPFPSDRWLADGGHHALDPWVALSFAAAATTRLRVQTHIAVLPYRNPFITASAVASLDVLSGGRLIVGVAAGYLRGEFRALGADFEGRNERSDEALVAIKRALTEEGVVAEGPGWKARGNTLLPHPIQRPHPPFWVGGNSRRAIRRAVDLGDGWVPFPTPGIRPSAVRTASMESLEDLAERIGYLRDYAKEVGRTAPLDICFMPFGFSMHDMRDMDATRFGAVVEELAEMGVTWLTVGLPGRGRDEYCESIRRFGEEVLAKLA